jgi:signal peptidase II
MATRVTRWALSLLMLGLVGCDHATKIVAKDELGAGKVVPLLRGWLDLRYVENFDTAFSLTHGWSSAWKAAVLTGLALVMTIIVTAIAWKRRQDAATLEHVGLVLVVAGSLGNALDRLRRGYVIDFIHLHHWPVFNVADILVVAGGILLFQISFRSARRVGRASS